MLVGLIASLLLSAVNLILLIEQLIIAIVLAIIDFVLACLYVVLRGLQWALPIVLRVAAVALWLASLYAAFGAVFALYSQFSDTLPTVAVSIALSSLVVIVPVMLILGREQPWGSLIFGALIGGGEWLVASNLIGHRELYQIVGVAPTVMATAGMLYLAVATKQRRISNERGRKSV
jgi:hypothetical protein